ncbi:MAG: glycoside hydrolase family 88 protein [Flavobacterium sp.]|nr:glycoside hydrolase family 88 protein [Flavobacterium sp.]
MLLNYVLIFAIFILLLVFLIDLFIHFNTWQSRIHIGRYDSITIWEKEILTKSCHWLKKTPTIKLTDNTRFIILDILRGNFKRDAIQHWQEASLLLGLYENYKKTFDLQIKKNIDLFIKSKIANGNWVKTPTEIDGVILAYAILNVDWINHQENKPAYDAMWNLVQNLIGEDGTAQYRKSMKNYRYVDTIGFICPFLITYGKLFKNEVAIDLGIKQITSFNQNGMFKDLFLPCHTYRIDSKMPVGLFGWGRGLGWYAIGLIDSWKELPNDHPEKVILTNSVIAFANTIMKFQNPNGSWNWIVSSPEAQADSSTTATLAWFLANVSSEKTISERSLESKNRALQFLMTVTRRDGAIDFSQGDTKAIGVHSQTFDILPFTQGFALRTACKSN